jgi:hypothetical protein
LKLIWSSGKHWNSWTLPSCKTWCNVSSVTTILYSWFSSYLAYNCASLACEVYCTQLYYLSGMLDIFESYLFWRSIVRRLLKVCWMLSLIWLIPFVICHLDDGC